MEAFPWAPPSPRRGRAPPRTALAPSAHYGSAPGPAHPPPFSSWNDYLGLATLITKAVGGARRFGDGDRGGGGGGGGGEGSPPSSSSSSCCSPHAGPGPGARGPALGPPDYEEDDDDDDSDDPGARARCPGGPAEAALLEGRFAELSPFAGRAAAVLLGCAPAAAPAEGAPPREERALAWAAEPGLHAASSSSSSSSPGAAAARLLKPELQVCVFCRNNKEAVALYTTHILKGPDGRVLCPVLRRYTCPLCGASGDSAHTIKYCPRSRPPPARGPRDGPPGRRLR